jgi:hypothetical protein
LGGEVDFFHFFKDSTEINKKEKDKIAGTVAKRCNRTDQIIRAQVQKQAPKRSNFRT